MITSYNRWSPFEDVQTFSTVAEAIAYFGAQGRVEVIDDETLVIFAQRDTDSPLDILYGTAPDKVIKLAK